MSKDIFISDTMRVRIEALDKALRDAGFLSPLAPPIIECDELVRLMVRSRGEDYQAGMTGRSISTQIPVVHPLPQAVTPKKDDK